MLARATTVFNKFQVNVWYASEFNFICDKFRDDVFVNSVLI